MSATLQLLIPYLERVLPGMILAVVVLGLTRNEPRVRIPIYLFCFILLRDAMTPLGLWSFGSQGWFWIRLSQNSLFLVIFALSCLTGAVALWLADRPNGALVVWWRGHWLMGVLVGLTGAACVVLPLVVIYKGVNVQLRGGAATENHALPLLLFALGGNLLEELLFRGYVMGYFALRMTRLRAGLAAAVIFAFGHVFLATTVTNVGYPLLLFTLWEGTVAGVVAAKHGVIASTITHGGAIFLLASSLL